MMYLLDTGIVAELRKAKAGTANAGLGEWAKGIPGVLMFMSVVSLHELEHGVLLAERRDRAEGGLLRRWLENSVIPAFADRILAVDLPIARRAAGLHVPDGAPLRDALIGATALIHGLGMVTQNAADFERFAGLEVFAPWS